MGSAQLDQVRRSRQLGSLRIVSALRPVVVTGMFVAIEVGVTTRWLLQFLPLRA
jgi:hypothetical protein